jgi:excisionase family DNA binding protein
MPDVLKPQAFHERFTLYLNAAGEAVERTFAEMTAPEVLAAIKWHASEGNRLEREAAPFAEIAEIVEAGGNLPVETSRQTIERAIVALRQAGEAQGKAARLMVLVRTNIPQWHRHPGLSLDAALRRFWPGGRAGSVIKEVVTMHPSRKKTLPPLAYTVAQVSEITTLGLRKINAMIADGRLKSVKVDGRRLVYASSVAALLPDEVA